MRPKLRRARRPILRLNLNLNRLTDRLNRSLTNVLTNRLPTALTELAENFENFPCRLNVGELTDLIDQVG
jgi:hypothetical protein